MECVVSLSLSAYNKRCPGCAGFTEAEYWEDENNNDVDDVHVDGKWGQRKCMKIT